jgi:competence protein ComEC
MPASGWLALGSVLAALAAPSVGAVVIALLAASLTVAGRSLGSLQAYRGHARGLAIAAIGGLGLAIRLVVLPTPPPTAAELPIGSGPWEATVESVGAVRDGSQVATVRLSEPGGARLAATLPRFPAIEPGMAVSVSGGVLPPPEDDPYGDYLRRTGIAGTLRARSLEIRPSESSPTNLLERLRRGAATALTTAIPEPEAGLAAGIVVGLRDRVDRDLAADFTTVGASHVVAISGWNIAIVAASIAALGGGLARRRRAVLTATAIVLYVAFAGASASVVRAAAMAGVVLVARESGRAGRAAAALGWAALLLLIADPHLVTDAGFQLSTLATAGILAWATPLGAWLTGEARGRLPGWLIECLAVSLAAQAATLPVVLVTFGRLAIVSPVVNLAIVPLVAPAMAASAVALGGGFATIVGAPALVATLLGLPAWFLLSAIVGIVEATASLPFASATLEPPWNVVGGLMTALVPAVVVGARRRLRSAPHTPARAPSLVSPRTASDRRPAPRVRARRIVVAALAVSLVAVGLAVAHRPDGSTKITVLDVGQGDAILVEGGRGGRLLVDGGPDPDRLLIELDERLPPWDRRIDVVVLTHPHEDHVAGLALLLARYRVGRVFEPGMHGPGPGYAAWDAELATVGAPERGLLVTGDRLAVDDLHFDVLWPDPGRVPLEPPDGGRSINDVSIVLLGEVGERRILLTGDVEDDVDPLLAARGLPPIDFLKVAHHGSGTASTVAFLGVVRPAVAVVSAGADNPYGHPARSTLDHLAATGAAVFRTDTDGSVEAVFADGGMTVRASGARAADAGPRLAATGATRITAPAFSCAVPSSG